MSDDDDEFKRLWDRFMATCTVTLQEVDPKTGKHKTELLIKDTLAYDGISFIMRALPPEARLGSINEAQAFTLTEKLTEDWFILVYINHYDDETEVIEKDPFYSSGLALILLLISRATAGRDRLLRIEEIKAKNPAANMIMNK